MTYITKVYKDEGGDRQVVDAGGELRIKGKLTLAAGAEVNEGDDVYVVAEPDDVSLEIGDDDKLRIKSQDAIADLELTAAEEFDSTELEAVAAKVDAILATLRAAKIIAAGD